MTQRPFTLQACREMSACIACNHTMRVVSISALDRLSHRLGGSAVSMSRMIRLWPCRSMHKSSSSAVYTIDFPELRVIASCAYNCGLQEEAISVMDTSYMTQVHTCMHTVGTDLHAGALPGFMTLNAPFIARSSSSQTFPSRGRLAGCLNRCLRILTVERQF